MLGRKANLTAIRQLMLSGIACLLCLALKAQQYPPYIEWQKSYGGSDRESLTDIKPTDDGGYVCIGGSQSQDGDLPGTKGFLDVWVMKIGASGNIQWSRTYGGLFNDYGTKIRVTVDGGYILTGVAVSTDGDVVGSNGGISDLWLVKLNSAGDMQWQKCYGGPGQELGSDIHQTPDGGYIISGQTTKNGGQVTGYHGSIDAIDVWIIKIDAVGNIEWQNCYGGSDEEAPNYIIPSSDGGYLFVTAAESDDGDVTCLNFREDLWIVKLDNLGIIQWQQCYGGNYGETMSSVIQTTDGGYAMTGVTYSTTLPGTFGNGDIWVLKLNSTGAMEWQKFFGGSEVDYAKKIIQTNDGSFVIAATVTSQDGNICNYEYVPLSNAYLIKLNASGDFEWQRAYGGSGEDNVESLASTGDGGYILSGFSNSNDNGIGPNHGDYDGWVVKFAFPGFPVTPAITIDGGPTTICPDKPVTFQATTDMGGDQPAYQWKINGVNAGENSPHFTTDSLKDGDNLLCELISNSPCATWPYDTSNIITIHVDPSLNPVNFLDPQAEICIAGHTELQPNKVFKTYFWNTNDTTPVITIHNPGTYSLKVTDNDDCPGVDSVVVILKECLKGVFMPTAFTPNGDGKNELARPFVGGDVNQYRFTITNRWGEIVFQTSEPGKGWDGRFRGVLQNSDVFVWTCTYQLPGEQVKHEKGHLTLIR